MREPTEPRVEAIEPLVERLARGGVGVGAWSVFGSVARRVSFGVKDRRIGTPHVPPSFAEGASASYVLVWDDGRVSRGSFERRQLARPDEALAQASAAAYDDPDATVVLGPQTVPDVTLWDDGTAALADGRSSGLDERLDAIASRMEDPRVRTWSASLSAAASCARLVTSAGLDLRGRGTSTGWHVSVNGAVGDGHGARASEPHAAFGERLDRLMTTVEALAAEAPPRRGGVVPVLLHPDVVDGFVLRTLLANLGGSAVAHGESHFPRDAFGATAPALREDLTLRLDPLVPLAAGSYRFTGEGVPAARIAYVDRGRLVTPLLDLKYARRLGLPPTPLPYGTDALRLEGPAPIEPDEAWRQAAGGVLVLSVLGVHTQDVSSGDFSLSSPHALALGGGPPSGHLRGTISGNLFEAIDDERLRLVRWPGETTPGLMLHVRFEPA